MTVRSYAALSISLNQYNCFFSLYQYHINFKIILELKKNTNRVQKLGSFIYDFHKF